MQKIEERNNVQSAENAADFSKFMKSQSLRLDKQTIRTLTGPELRAVGGASGISRCTVNTQNVTDPSVPH